MKMEGTDRFLDQTPWFHKIWGPEHYPQLVFFSWGKTRGKSFWGIPIPGRHPNLDLDMFGRIR
jgi:hypothetical protein